MATITYLSCAEYLRRQGYLIDGPVFQTAPRIMVQDIKDAVCRTFKILPHDLIGEKRSREYARPRQVAMYLCRFHTQRSLPDIGRRFGDRDHTTVIHACRQIEKLRKEDIELDYNIHAIESELALA